MFNVKGVTETGKLVKLNDFSSKTTTAAQNGDSCEVEITSQGQSATAIVNITRKPVFEQNIGYPNEEDATVTCYSNGDLEFEGKGELTNFGTCRKLLKSAIIALQYYLMKLKRMKS